MSQVTLDSPITKRVSGLGMLVVFAGIVALVLAMFNGAFTSTTTVSLQADRAGLMMAAKDRVKYHGVQVGSVSSVELNGNIVKIVMQLDPSQASIIPANVTAAISPETAFGNKFIELQSPRAPAPGRLRNGTVLIADHIGTEINTVFQNLMNVLTVVKPSQVNETLQALSSSLQGRGDQLGRFLSEINSYLGSFNPLLPELDRDMIQVSNVSNLYADISPQFFKTLENATQIGATVTDKQVALHDFLQELTRLGATGTDLFKQNGQNLIDTMRLLEPTSALLDKYSPELSCFLQGEDNARRLLEPALGGKKQSGVLTVNILPGKEPYQYPNDLPEVNAASGPDCHGLPNLANTPVPAPEIVITGNGYVPPSGQGSDDVQLGNPPLQLLLDPTRRQQGAK
ncbi:MCE family protein [Amycolatopsis acidiphila]|uniref:MCE family protein n=1 Tax=Amycolatopsis acidiphila TaxID=715473 RepID=A0A558AHY1_9PSEU|nr:MCE family protein [Amycolatopsis acidiphila]TVT23870.1 MCE family protein [Amycolatopsis acidiphila]UIJ61155.1 MCE family protein [Amycolatopsis acidiphila]GHG86391.1 virulence factor [Amycolatopsis acidiphila]